LRACFSILLGLAALLASLASPSASQVKAAGVKPAPSARAEARQPGMVAGFASFIEGLWPEASAAGVSRQTFDAAFAGVHLDQDVISRTRKQAEFERSIRDYVASAASPRQVQQGRELAARWGEMLATVERRYGVARDIVLALWGLESNYGAGIGGKDVISSLASLAYIRFRGDLFRDELINALVILQEGDVARGGMKGSWAGAMGQAQFMPSSFLKYAAAFDGGPRKDIWTNTPDVLASIASFLRGNGWQAGLPWGFEVKLPQGFDYAAAKASFAEWRRRGVTRADGEAMPSSGEALIFFPVGWKGPAFLITDNFFAIKSYNTSDSYALSAGVLADRIGGSEGIRAPWPAKIDALDHAKRLEAQRLLAKLGLYSDKLDGFLGPSLREAVRRFQAENGMIADGFPTPDLLTKLRAAAT
jgi:membrane-bound lytic murein transglycosylase B